MKRVARLPGFDWGDRQECQCGGEQNKVEDSLGARFEQARTEMRISVAGQEHDLKEKHAGCPNAGASTEPGKNIFADNRLHLEEQESTGEDRQRVQGHVEDILPRCALGTICNLTVKGLARMGEAGETGFSGMVDYRVVLSDPGPF